MIKNLLEKVVFFDGEDKDFFLKDLDNQVDEGIREVVDAINTIDDFVTMNSCQGGGTPYPDTEHCPITYVDFYVLHHNYTLAECFFIFLKRELGDEVYCKLSFEEEIYLDDDEYVIPTGGIEYRYRVESLLGYDTQLLQKLAHVIREFKMSLDRGNGEI
ncbi:hypothetical protein CN331_21090 [Bacillus cereus]|uniref:hypothetical protein n=1 Tax=Bacillus cereus TaxID=1396 RepID=UPI000BF5E4CD|nr:hypothetical protein [Bacillus cereus]PEY15536.1 hypothetical protein CN331_21090 [Bacillus cereus]